MRRQRGFVRSGFLGLLLITAELTNTNWIVSMKPCIKLNKISNNFWKKERVIAGRENLVNAIREFSVTYLHCDWLPGYLEAFSEQKNRMESIMQAIETEERNQMGQSLEGTVLDFTTIRAMLDGLEQSKQTPQRN